MTAEKATLQEDLAFLEGQITERKTLIKEYKSILKKVKREGKFFLKSENKPWATASVKGKAATYEKLIENLERDIGDMEASIEKISLMKKETLDELNSIDS